MNRRVHVFGDQLLGNDNGVFKVVSAPWHKSHQHVFAQRQLTFFRRKTFRQRRVLFDPLPGLYNGRLVDARVLVRAAELGQEVGLDRILERHVGIIGIGIVANDNAGSIGELDDPRAFRHQHRARVAGDAAFEARAHDRRLRPQQRHGLALHVRAHQGAVGVVMLQERDQARRRRYDLVRSDVHVLHFVR